MDGEAVTLADTGDSVRAGIGAAPHRWAQAASECSRSGLSPAATSSAAALSGPTP